MSDQTVDLDAHSAELDAFNDKSAEAHEAKTTRQMHARVSQQIWFDLNTTPLLNWQDPYESLPSLRAWQNHIAAMGGGATALKFGTEWSENPNPEMPINTPTACKKLAGEVQKATAKSAPDAEITDRISLAIEKQQGYGF